VKPRRSLLALVTFCATTAFVAALALSIVFVSATAAYALAAAFDAGNEPALQEFSGVIGDSRCGGRHAMSNKSPEECTRLCVTQGAKYVLVNGENVYTLDGNTAAFSSLAGERVTISGALDGSTLKVTSVKPIRPAPPGE
jgi:hypothetical protein